LDLVPENVDNTLMFSVAAMKSRTFPATEQVCRSWEGAQTDS